MQIRIHYRDKLSDSWSARVVEVGQVPVRGEYIAPAPIQVFRVVLTLHVLFDADYEAEVFAELIDFEQVQADTLGNVVWAG
jgi:hypothetical protein